MVIGTLNCPLPVRTKVKIILWTLSFLDLKETMPVFTPQAAPKGWKVFKNYAEEISLTNCLALVPCKLYSVLLPVTTGTGKYRYLTIFIFWIMYTGLVYGRKMSIMVRYRVLCILYNCIHIYFLKFTSNILFFSW